MKRTLFRTALLTLLCGLALTAGMVFAQNDVDEPVITSGTWCVNFVGWCDEDILVWSNVARPNYYSVVGWHYGCSMNPTYVQDGSMWINGNTANIYWLTSVADGQRICNWNAQIDLGVGNGPLQMACHDDTYWTYAGTAQIVPCPAEMLDRDGPSATQK